tara:strand:+ start:2697 stop:3176 length:480 start_codon:yes stop_codon:yes gene_type:complete
MILDNDKIFRICNRLAYQIIEESDESDYIFLVGIKEKGFEIAEIIEKQIISFSKRKVNLYSIEIEKNNDSNSIKFNHKLSKNCLIFLIDDVLNTGKTLFKCVNYFFNIGLENIKTIVLIDRDHKKFPVNVDIKGVSLSTNFEDTVRIISEKKKLRAELV